MNVARFRVDLVAWVVSLNFWAWLKGGLWGWYILMLGRGDGHNGDCSFHLRIL